MTVDFLYVLAAAASILQCVLMICGEIRERRSNGGRKK